MQPVAILASGMLTGVGLSGPTTCAAIRCAIDSFAETRFMDCGGEWIIGSEVPLEQPWRGLQRLVQMVVPAIRECLSQAGGVAPGSIPLLLAVAERERPGRLEGLEDGLFRQVVAEMGVRFHERSAVMPLGRIAGAVALGRACQLLYEEQVPLCLIAGVDSLLVAPTLTAYEERNRLLTSQNSNGLIPGEAGAAVLVARPGRTMDPDLLCRGIGVGQEPATIESEQPLRGDGMAQAFRFALEDADASLDEVQYRIADLNGEQYSFKEAAVAFSRTARKLKPAFELWHPADCVGEIGAAVGPFVLGVALAAARKRYAPGPGVLCHFAEDGTRRTAVILSYLASGAA